MEVRGGGGAGGGGGGGQATASTALGLAAIGAWVIGGAKFALDETAKVLSQTTTPQLRSTWFSSAYWRMTAIAAVLTLPFLFAAAIQALLRSDLALLARAALCYLPVALLAVSIAAPLTMLLLSASDELSAFVSSAAGQAGARLMGRGAALLGALTVLSGSPFIAFLVGVLTASAALVLWLELLIREVAVYVIVLMLPLVFAAFVWPARRVWAVRAVELLVALILSKFAIVAVLSLGGAALTGSGLHSVTGSLAGIVLLLMGAFAPWVLLRLVPLAELASGAAGALRTEGRVAMRTPVRTAAASAEWSDAKWGSDWAALTMGGMRRQAEEAASANGSSGEHSTRQRLAELALASGSNGEPHVEAAGTAVPSAGCEDGTTAADQAPSEAGADPPSGNPERSVATPADQQGSTSAPAERVPGLHPMWQARDESWKPMELPGNDWPPRPWSADESGEGPAESAPTPDPEPAGTADDHDPRPPAQAPEDGRL